MRLSELLQRAGQAQSPRRGDPELASVTIDSRRVTPGALFVCMPGMTRDSQSFLPDAAANGAAAALVYDAAGLESAQALGLAAAQIGDYDEAIWRICDAFFEHPTRHLKVLGVTGTNGKTTTAWLVRDMLAAIGLRTAYLGTLGFHLPGEERELANTTPFAVDLYNLLAEARDRGVEALAMEVSSHALAQKRVDGVEFDAAVFTNLTQDHLDFHGTMEAYESAKLRLFIDLPRQSEKRFVAALNVGDPTGRRWANLIDALTYELGGDAPVDLRGLPHQVAVDRIELELQTAEDRATGQASLGGMYNAENLLSACAALIALDRATGLLGNEPKKLERIASLMPKVRPVPGRFEAVPNDQGIGILVDYAHTPDALEKLLDTVRPLTQGKVITVFGCGGDRDRAKRPLMAKAASERSDYTVLTSDNPRTEDPEQILRDAAVGLVNPAASTSVVDRAEAVAIAVRKAKPGDVVVIAGKGHETYQIVGREKIHMDDRELARAALSGGRP